jgi:hypothetical protein
MENEILCDREANTKAGTNKPVVRACMTHKQQIRTLCKCTNVSNTQKRAGREWRVELQIELSITLNEGNPPPQKAVTTSFGFSHEPTAMCSYPGGVQSQVFMLSVLHICPTWTSETAWHSPTVFSSIKFNADPLHSNQVVICYWWVEQF